MCLLTSGMTESLWLVEVSNAAATRYSSPVALQSHLSGQARQSRVLNHVDCFPKTEETSKNIKWSSKVSHYRNLWNSHVSMPSKKSRGATDGQHHKSLGDAGQVPVFGAPTVTPRRPAMDAFCSRRIQRGGSAKLLKHVETSDGGWLFSVDALIS